MTTYQIIYLLTEIFLAYILTLYFGCFFSRIRTGMAALAATYVVFLLVTDGVYLLFNNYKMNAVLNIVFLFLISMHYEASYKKRIVSVLLIYILMAMVETFVVTLTGSISEINETAYDRVIGPVIIKFALFIVALLMRNLKSVRENVFVPLPFWVSIFVVPAGSVYLVFNVIANNVEHFNNLQMVLCVAIIFLMNIATFYLYDSIAKSYTEKVKTELLKQENKHYMQQLDNMQIHIDEVIAFRHDFRNHLEVLYSMMDQNAEQAKAYITSIAGVLSAGYQYSKTGNIALDSVLNYKLSKAKENNIEVMTDIAVPPDLAIDAPDMVAIFGNLLDNALNASFKIKDFSMIDVYMYYHQGVLESNISNMYHGDLKYMGDKLQTTSSDKTYHGYGLRNVNNALKKYNGRCEISHSDSIFNVRVIMYL